MAAGVHDARGGAADGDPHWQLTLDRAWVYPGVLEWCAMPAGPGDVFVAVESHEQVEFLLEQVVVVGEVVAEQREGFGVRGRGRR